MSEIKHPRFNGENEANIDIKLQFAEEALDVIVDHGVICNTVDETDVVEDAVSVTPRYDCPTAEKSVYASVRLREMNQSFTVQLAAEGDVFEPTGQKAFTALILETAEYNDITLKNLEVDSDEIVQWDDYVAIIFETGTTDKNISIVNAATGEELSFEDMLEAYAVFSALKSYLLSERFESFIAPDDDIKSDEQDIVADFNTRTEMFQAQDGTIREFKDFNPSFYHLDYECAQCGNPGPLCEEHASPWKT